MEQATPTLSSAPPVDSLTLTSVDQAIKEGRELGHRLTAGLPRAATLHATFHRLADAKRLTVAGIPGSDAEWALVDTVADDWLSLDPDHQAARRYLKQLRRAGLLPHTLEQSAEDAVYTLAEHLHQTLPREAFDEMMPALATGTVADAAVLTAVHDHLTEWVTSAASPPSPVASLKARAADCALASHPLSERATRPVQVGGPRLKAPISSLRTAPPADILAVDLGR